MKKLVALGVFLASFQMANAQVEIKTNPVAILFEALPVSVEYLINDSWGMELDAFVASGGGALYLSGKHYFSPSKGADGFNLGTFVGGLGGDGDSGFGLGFFAGYKAVSSKNVLLELALGVGRDFTGDIEVLPFGKLHVGYRFGGK
jgi:hypothetical protein